MTKRALLLLAFIEGGLVMLLETSSPLIVAPILGHNVIVWATMISISIGALALGYYLGGLLSKKQNREQLITWLFILNTASVLLGWFLMYLQNSSSSALATVSGSYLIVLFTLFLPLIGFGATTPIVVGDIQSKFEENSSIVGKVYSLSTVGGIVLSIITGYMLLPEFGISDTLLFGAFVAALTIGISTKSLSGTLKFMPYGLAIIALISMGINSKPSESEDLEVLYTSESINGQLVVADFTQNGRKQRILFINRIGQTWVDLKSNNSLWPYVNVIASTSSIYPEGSRTLILGLGGGLLANHITLHSKHKVDAVELDQRIVGISEEYFDLDPSVEVYTDDARRYISRTGEKYDFIVFDIFSGETIPSHCLSKESFEKTKTILNKNGLIAINFNGFINGEAGLPGRSLLKTLWVAGFDVQIFDASFGRDKESNRNLIYLAYRKGESPDWSKIDQSETILFNKFKVGVHPFMDQSKIAQDGIVITDDKPVMEYINRLAAEAWRKSYIENFTMKFRNKYHMPLTF